MSRYVCCSCGRAKRVKDAMCPGYPECQSWGGMLRGDAEPAESRALDWTEASQILRRRYVSAGDVLNESLARYLHESR